MAVAGVNAVAQMNLREPPAKRLVRLGMGGRG
jgi:hypothetical protein